MKTKKNILLGIGFLLLVLVLVIIFEKQSVRRMSTYYISDGKREKLLASHELVEDSLVKKLNFGEQELVFDSKTNTFYYSLIEDDDAFNPIVKISEDVDAAVCFCGPPISHDTITLNQPISVMFFDKKKVSVASLICTTLPVMNIEVSPQTVDEFGFDDIFYTEEYAPMTVTLFDNRGDFDGASRTQTSDGKFRIRGGTTASAPMNSYRITLLEDKKKPEGKLNHLNFLGLREDDDWILYSGYSDYEKIRNVFSSQLWHDMADKNNIFSVPNSVQYKYVELFFNGSYYGLYALGHPLDSKQADIKKDEYLFKKKDWSTTEKSQEMEFLEFEDGSGYDWLPGYFLNAGDEEGYEKLHDLYYTIAYSDDPAAIEKTGDLDNAIDLLLFYRLTQAVDNVYCENVKNLIVSVKKSDNNSTGYALLFAPWDLDQTFGNGYYDGTGSHGICSYCYSPESNFPQNWNMARAAFEAGDEGVYDKLASRYDELRSGVWSESHIDELLDGYQAQIYGSGAISRTIERWPDANYNDPGEGLSTFREYVHERLKYMDSEVKDKSLLTD